MFLFVRHRRGHPASSRFEAAQGAIFSQQLGGFSLANEAPIEVNSGDVQQIGMQTDIGETDMTSDCFRLPFVFRLRHCRWHEDRHCTILHMTQEQSAARFSLPKRLETLRLAKQLTWDGMAALLEISPSMIYQVKRGDRTFGDLVLHRLEEEEIKEGLLSVQDASFERLLRNPELAQSLDSKHDPAADKSHDDYIKMRLEVLANIVDTYDSKEMELLLTRLKTLAFSDKQFGKVFEQMVQVVVHLQFRKERQEDREVPRTRRKGK